MQVKSQRSSKKARIEIIPLIDVIMFLLATFVLFTLSMNKTKNIVMNMPGPGVPTEGPPPVTVSVDSNGDYFWNKERITYDDLLVRLNGLRQQDADPKVVVVGEEGAQFGKALSVVDEARNARIFKVSFNTKAVKSVR
jgi:biopolymer transport protein ExbD